MKPTFKTEKDLIANGDFLVCGIDEVGRGAWAGPVVVGTAIFKTHKIKYKLNDSKTLKEKQRKEIYKFLINDLLDFSVGVSSAAEIDKYGMSEALRIASQRALFFLNHTPDTILLDGKYNYLKTKINSKTYIGGDNSIASICAAGIIAKVTRDKIMEQHHAILSHYRFHKHKGYGTYEHKKLIDIYGPSNVHRKSFNIKNSWTKIEKI